MKIINSKDYQFNGSCEGWFIYTKILNGKQIDEEVLLVKRCIYIHKDGSRQIYDITQHSNPSVVFVPKTRMKRDYPLMKTSLHDSAVKSIVSCV